MTLGKLPTWAGDLVDRQRVARLAFVDGDDRPRVLPVTFARVGETIWSAIDDHKPKRGGEPARVRWLRRRPQAALLVDVYDDDWSRLAWVQALGEVAIVEPGAGAGVEALAARYEPYRARPPTGPLLRLDVERALCWRAADYDV